MIPATKKDILNIITGMDSRFPLDMAPDVSDYDIHLIASDFNQLASDAINVSKNRLIEFLRSDEIKLENEPIKTSCIDLTEAAYSAIDEIWQSDLKGVTEVKKILVIAYVYQVVIAAIIYYSNKRKSFGLPENPFYRPRDERLQAFCIDLYYRIKNSTVNEVSVSLPDLFVGEVFYKNICEELSLVIYILFGKVDYAKEIIQRIVCERTCSAVFGY